MLMKTSKIFALIILVVCVSCNWTKEKTKEAANKTGEVVAKTGSELVNGVAKGIEKSFANEIIVSEKLKTDGLRTGKMLITGTDSTTDNILSAYMIFEKPFNQQVTVKVFDDQGLEYGRVSKPVTGNAGEGKYLDFVFDKRTNIDGRGKITFE